MDDALSEDMIVIRCVIRRPDEDRQRGDGGGREGERERGERVRKRE